MVVEDAVDPLALDGQPLEGVREAVEDADAAGEALVSDPDLMVGPGLVGAIAVGPPDDRGGATYRS